MAPGLFIYTVQAPAYLACGNWESESNGNYGTLVDAEFLYHFR